VAARMTYRDLDIGEAQVVLDVAAVTRRVIRAARRQVLVAAGILLGVGLSIAFVVSGMVSRPLRRLRLAVNALAAGDLSARVEPSSRDEIGVLARAFNEMSESLGEKRRIETAFRRYVSDHVLREVIDSPESIHLKGELREVSVIYLDIRKFTRLTGTIGPERTVAFLNECFDLITGRLLEHGATVDKYIGDAILSYLGAPIETDDHAQRAVAAAIAVQRAIHERNRRCEATGQPFVRLEVGIGIHTGPVVVGNIGSELKMDYTAIGEPVNVANRLQSLAGPGQIKITGEVRARLGELIDVKPEGTRMLEGVDHPIEVFEVLYYWRFALACSVPVGRIPFAKSGACRASDSRWCALWSRRSLRRGLRAWRSLVQSGRRRGALGRGATSRRRAGNTRGRTRGSRRAEPSRSRVPRSGQSSSRTRAGSRRRCSTTGSR
jgi:class 3 adenylate cyclase